MGGRRRLARADKHRADGHQSNQDQQPPANEHQPNQDQPPADNEHPDIDDDEWRGFPDSDVEVVEQEPPRQPSAKALGKRSVRPSHAEEENEEEEENASQDADLIQALRQHGSSQELISTFCSRANANLTKRVPKGVKGFSKSKQMNAKKRKTYQLMADDDLLDDRDRALREAMMAAITESRLSTNISPGDENEENLQLAIEASRNESRRSGLDRNNGEGPANPRRVGDVDEEIALERALHQSARESAGPRPGSRSGEGTSRIRWGYWKMIDILMENRYIGG